MKSNIEQALIQHLTHTEKVTKTRITKKLNNLYNGEIFIKNNIDAYINLSNQCLTEDQKEVSFLPSPFSYFNTFIVYSF